VCFCVCVVLYVSVSLRKRSFVFLQHASSRSTTDITLPSASPASLYYKTHWPTLGHNKKPEQIYSSKYTHTHTHLEMQPRFLLKALGRSSNESAVQIGRSS